MYRVSWRVIQDALDKGEPLRFSIWRQEGTTLPKRFDPKLFSGMRDRKVREAAKALARQMMRKAAQH